MSFYIFDRIYDGHFYFWYVLTNLLHLKYPNLADVHILRKIREIDASLFLGARITDIYVFGAYISSLIDPSVANFNNALHDPNTRATTFNASPWINGRCVYCTFPYHYFHVSQDTNTTFLILCVSEYNIEYLTSDNSMLYDNLISSSISLSNLNTVIVLVYSKVVNDVCTVHTKTLTEPSGKWLHTFYALHHDQHNIDKYATDFLLMLIDYDNFRTIELQNFLDFDVT